MSIKKDQKQTEIMIGEEMGEKKKKVEATVMDIYPYYTPGFDFQHLLVLLLPSGVKPQFT